ncbi:N-acetyltransferase [Polaribacter sp. SA4-12]|uniref:N-acetyltransferase n=1 Tax=Polaribacter sp. SA4-12 TaxID=1312072 RepID=UPI000B3D1CB1|nr:GNAT family N-acetyltransferase [Polaribacter sp. SA4-12]
MSNFITLNSDSISKEHICCAISDKKYKESYDAKKDWLKNEFEKGYVFRRINERAKVFIEYGNAEESRGPITAPNYLNINCFWVSGKYKKQGHAKKLLQSAIDDAKNHQKSGLVTVVGTKKFHFMSDTKWFLKQGFIEVDKTISGFSLLTLKIDSESKNPTFNESVKSGSCQDKKGIVVYYSNRCPFAEFHALNSIKETAEKRSLSLKVIKLKTKEEAQNAPSPATIFSLFLDGQFITTDISICMDSRFDKVLNKVLNK